MEIKIKKAEQTVIVDETRLADHVRAFLYNYGVRQFLNDSISSLSREGSKTTTKATSDEMMASVAETIARLYNGETRATRAVDTLGRMAFNLAMKKVCNRWLKTHAGGNVIKDYATRNADAETEYNANKAKYDDMAQSLIELTSGEDA